MSRISVVDTVIGELCQSMGLADSPLDDRGRLALRFDDTPVMFSYAAKPIEMLWLHVDLGETPKGRAALEFLLRLGFDCWCLNRMTIGLDRDGHRAVGHSCVPVSELSLERLDQALGALLEVAVPIRERLLAGDFSIGVESMESDQRPSGGRPPRGMLRV
ncbi:MAG: type III secretion system chaperone [Pseudomonadota bacterium]